jgi:P27 family predicted phage terminase small subunit
MARPKKPTAIKRANGTLQKCRVLANEYSPKTLGGFDVPPFLNETQSEVFVTLAEKFKGEGILAATDLEGLVAYAIEYEKYIFATKDINKNGVVDFQGEQNPYVKIADMALKSVIRLSTEFGMTPAARTKVAIAPKKETTLKDMLSDGFGN